jgi:DNA invertase Pin-like site-specific DNA recombinase
VPFYNVLVSVWYTDFITGISTLKRSGFQQALQDAQGDRFDVLLVYHTSRFARNRADAIRYKAELRLLGKTVVFVSQGIISGNDNDFLNEGINEVLDEHYFRNLSLWVRDGLRVKALEGNPLGNAPLGFKHVPRAGGRGVDTVIDEATMPALLALLGGYESGQHSFNTIAQELNARGHRMS